MVFFLRKGLERAFPIYLLRHIEVLAGVEIVLQSIILIQARKFLMYLVWVRYKPKEFLSASMLKK